jgi:hypothetical protein
VTRQLEAVHAGHFDVGDQHQRHFVIDQRGSLAAVFGQHDAVVVLLQQAAGLDTNDLGVVGDHDQRFFGAARCACSRGDGRCGDLRFAGCTFGARLFGSLFGSASLFGVPGGLFCCPLRCLARHLFGCPLFGVTGGELGRTLLGQGLRFGGLAQGFPARHFALGEFAFGFGAGGVFGGDARGVFSGDARRTFDGQPGRLFGSRGGTQRRLALFSRLAFLFGFCCGLCLFRLQLGRGLLARLRPGPAATADPRSGSG